VIKIMLPDEHRGRPRKTASGPGDLADDRTEINDTGGLTGTSVIDWGLLPCTAFNEAGHAWVYDHTYRPLHFVTIEPEGIRRGRTVGRDSWGPLIAAAGPIAEARWYFDKLVDVGTVTGLEGFDVFFEAKYGRKPVGR
jgi:hypothetical protein